MPVSCIMHKPIAMWYNKLKFLSKWSGKFLVLFINRLKTTQPLSVFISLPLIITINATSSGAAWFCGVLSEFTSDF